MSTVMALHKMNIKRTHWEGLCSISQTLVWSVFNPTNFGMVCHVSCGMDIHSDLQNDNKKEGEKIIVRVP